jgi:hypothetical protein
MGSSQAVSSGYWLAFSPNKLNSSSANNGDYEEILIKPKWE